MLRLRSCDPTSRSGRCSLASIRSQPGAAAHDWAEFSPATRCAGSHLVAPVRPLQEHESSEAECLFARAPSAPSEDVGQVAFEQLRLALDEPEPAVEIARAVVAGLDHDT